jgi:hypothetical protein
MLPFRSLFAMRGDRPFEFIIINRRAGLVSKGGWGYEHTPPSNFSLFMQQCRFSALLEKLPFDEYQSN